jgi:hypothetical protein
MGEGQWAAVDGLAASGLPGFAALPKVGRGPCQCPWHVCKVLKCAVRLWANAGCPLCHCRQKRKDLEKASEEWSSWCAVEAPERMAMPGDWGRVGEIRKLLLLRALRPDRITNALQV